jgi:hypothetical protein
MSLNGFRHLSAFNSNQIVRDSLIYYLDAADSRSYPGSGTTWFEFIASRNSVLTNGPTFSASGGGAINFDGVDDFSVSNIPSTSITNITIMGFVNVVLNRKGPFFRVGDIANNIANGYAIGIGDTTFAENGNNIIALFPNVRWISTTTQWNAGWQMVTFILGPSSVVSGFKNLDPISFPTGNPPNIPTSNLVLARNVGDEPDVVRAANCQIGNFMFYSKALSQQEIEQNFNAFRGRYGI